MPKNYNHEKIRDSLESTDDSSMPLLVNSIAWGLLLFVAYFIFDWWKPTEDIFLTIRTLGLGLITNFIPVLFIFFISYGLFNKYQRNKLERDRKYFISMLANETEHILEKQLEQVNKQVAQINESVKVLDLGKLNLEKSNLSLMYDSLKSALQSLQSHQTVILNKITDTKYLIDKKSSIAIKAYIAQAFESGKYELTPNKLEELSLKISRSIENVITEGEKGRVERMKNEIGTGVNLVGKRIDGVMSQIQDWQEDLSIKINEDIAEQFGNLVQQDEDTKQVMLQTIRKFFKTEDAELLNELTELLMDNFKHAISSIKQFQRSRKE